MHASTTLISAALAGDTAESLYAQHRDRRPWIYWLTLLGVIGAIASLPLIEVDVTVHAPGAVRPATERTELRVPIGAQIEQVLVRDNDHVTAGQPLLVLRSRDLEERVALNHVHQLEKTALVSDLQLLTKESDPPAENIATEELSSSVPAHGSSTNARLPGSALEATSTTAPIFLSAELRTDYVQLRTQLASQGLAIAKARREFTRSETLAAKGLITTHEMDQAHDDLSSAIAEQSTLVASTRNRREARLREEQSALDTLRAEDKRLEEEFMQSTIRAPVTGSVQGFPGLFPGAWLAAGQLVGTVSPDDQLLIETLVSPRDVGFLSPGQAAHLQIDAFPYTQWGLLEGTVVSIAEDSHPTSSSDSAGGFKVTIKTTSTVLHLPNGATGTLRKGMTLSARFVITRRSLLQMLYEDVGAWLNPQEAQRPS